MVWILQFWNSFVCSFVLSESFLQTGGERFLFLQVLDRIQGSRKPKPLTLVSFKAVQHNSVGLHRRKPVSPMPCQWYSKHCISWLKDLKPSGDHFSWIRLLYISYAFYPVLFFHATCRFTFRVYHLRKYLFLAQRFPVTENCCICWKAIFVVIYWTLLNDSLPFLREESREKSLHCIHQQLKHFPTEH